MILGHFGQLQNRSMSKLAHKAISAPKLFQDWYSPKQHISDDIEIINHEQVPYCGPLGEISEKITV